MSDFLPTGRTFVKVDGTISRYSKLFICIILHYFEYLLIIKDPPLLILLAFVAEGREPFVLLQKQSSQFDQHR